MTDEQLMQSVREITNAAIEPQVQRLADKVRLSGDNVTIYEVSETGALLMIVHRASKPSIEAIRLAFEKSNNQLRAA